VIFSIKVADTQTVTDVSTDNKSCLELAATRAMKMADSGTWRALTKEQSTKTETHTK